MVMARQEWHFEPAVCGVLNANKEPEAEGADRESPHRRFVAAPSADEPRANDSEQPDATDPEKVVPHRRVSIFSPTFSPEKRVHVGVVSWGFPTHARFARGILIRSPCPGDVPFGLAFALRNKCPCGRIRGSLRQRRGA
jgi:hypothetical protein